MAQESSGNISEAIKMYENALVNLAENENSFLTTQSIEELHSRQLFS